MQGSRRVALGTLQSLSARLGASMRGDTVHPLASLPAGAQAGEDTRASIVLDDATEHEARR